MLKKLVLALGYFIFITQLQAQQTNKFYEQLIEGTRASFMMQYIPAGKYSMGSKNGRLDELPVHEVKLDAFWMSKFEITWDVFELYLYKDYEKTNSLKISDQVDAVTRPSKPYLDMTFGMGKQNYPAVAMTQYNALQFCKWLYARTGLFYRLPTEAEWEYACRAGNDQDYSFGNEVEKLGDYAWYKQNSDKKTQQVGLKLPNAWGLHDMHGNVAEWTFDQYKSGFYAEKTILTNPVAPATQLYPLVIRGGSYEDLAKDLRSAARAASDPAWKQIDPQIPKSNWWFPDAPFVGIRIVRPVLIPSLTEIESYYNKPPIKDF